VLHDASFRDDPTRLLRGARYAARLELEWAAETRESAIRDLGLIDAVSGDRIRHEIERILEEPEPERALKDLHELGILHHLTSGLVVDEWLEHRFGTARAEQPSEGKLRDLYLLLLVYRLSGEQVMACASRLNLPAGLKRLFRELLRIREVALSLVEPDVTPADIVERLESFSPTTLQAAAIAEDSNVLRRYVRQYLERWRFVRPALSGEDVIGVGVAPGPAVGTALRSLRRAVLNERIGPEEERGWLKRWLRDQGAGSTVVDTSGNARLE
jgi:tRNA nucleotidyltransferase (CCA-adding enzyme)